MVFPRTWSRIVWNSEPWRGLVKKSASMFSVGQYVTWTIPRVTRSLSQKKPMSIWRVCSAAGRPFSISLIVL